MNYGVAIFFTDYSIGPIEIGTALEERGFESLWAPEHSHIPLTRKSSYPKGGELPKQYYDVMDPFVGLAVDAGKFDVAHLRANAPMAAVAVGLSLRQPGDNL